MSYDQHCAQLARLFIENRRIAETWAVDELAQTIQDVIEDWLEHYYCQQNEIRFITNFVKNSRGDAMPLVREHRGSLSDSMGTVRRVENRSMLLQIINEGLRPYGRTVTDEQVLIKHYAFDERIGWDTYLISIVDYGVWGMSNGPIPNREHE